MMVVSRMFCVLTALAAVGCCLSAGVLNAQDVVPLPPVEEPVDVGSGDLDLPPPPDSPDDVDPLDPVDPPPMVDLPEPWSRERTTTNAAGDVVNTHRWYGEDGADYSSWNREHTVTNPAGQHSQSWSYYRSDDGYNYERSRVITLRDGRTIEHTQVRTWDGETGSYRWTFVGPNGQTRERERAWAPDVDPADVPDLAGDQFGGSFDAPQVASTETLPAEPTSPVSGFFARIFGSSGKTTAQSRPAPINRPGFTIGSGRGPPGNELRGQRLGLSDRGAKGPSWRAAPRFQREMARVHPPHPQGLSKLRPTRVATTPSRPSHAGGPH